MSVGAARVPAQEGPPGQQAASLALDLTGSPALVRRRRVETVWRTILVVACLMSAVALIVLLVRMVSDASGALANLQFWTNKYTSSGIKDGTAGIADSVASSAVVLAMAMIVAVPVGTAAGIYLQEYAPRTRLTEWIRTTVANLAGVPSVVYGLLGLAIFVRMMADLSNTRPMATNLAAALTLAVLVLPIVIVATEEALKTVPQSVRHASLGLGATQWQTLRHHVLPYSMPGVLTGQILALSRAAGETAPLLILGIPILSTGVSWRSFLPWTSSTPLQVRAFNLSEQAAREGILLAAGFIVVLLLATLVLNLVAILLRNRLQRRLRW